MVHDRAVGAVMRCWRPWRSSPARWPSPGSLPARPRTQPAQRTSSAATARQQALSSATAPPPAGRQPRQRQLPLQGGRVRLPQRSIIETTAGAHTLHINYQTVSGGKHAYDYLTSYNFTETDANACFNRPPCVARTPVAIPIDTAPGGPAAYQADDPQQFIHIWNGEITSVGYVGNVYGATARARRRRPFTATSSTVPVVIAWGAHFASSIDWGVGLGAGSITGSPFHVDTNPGAGPPAADVGRQQAAALRRRQRFRRRPR